MSPPDRGATPAGDPPSGPNDGPRGPGDWPPGPLAAPFLALVLERLAEEARALAEHSEASLPVTAAGAVEGLLLRSRELSWALGVVGAALGANLLLARRHAGGLEVLAELVGTVHERAGAPPPLLEGPLPRLSPAVGEGWELPWALASTLFLLPGRRVVLAERAWHIAGEPCPDLEGLVAAVRRRLPLFELGRGDGAEPAIRFPAGWLEEAD